MAFELYAHVCVPKFATDDDGNPTTMSPIHDYKRVFVERYATRLLAQWWGINMKRVYIDDPPTKIATEQQIRMYEIVEVP